MCCPDPRCAQAAAKSQALVTGPVQWVCGELAGVEVEVSNPAAVGMRVSAVQRGSERVAGGRVGVSTASRRLGVCRIADQVRRDGYRGWPPGMGIEHSCAAPLTPYQCRQPAMPTPVLLGCPGARPLPGHSASPFANPAQTRHHGHHHHFLITPNHSPIPTQLHQPCPAPPLQVDKLTLEAAYLGDASMAPVEYMTITSSTQAGRLHARSPEAATPRRRGAPLPKSAGLTGCCAGHGLLSQACFRPPPWRGRHRSSLGLRGPLPACLPAASADGFCLGPTRISDCERTPARPHSLDDALVPLAPSLPALQAAWKPKPVSLNIPANTKPVRIVLEGTPLLKGMLVLTGCRQGTGLLLLKCMLVFTGCRQGTGMFLSARACWCSRAAGKGPGCSRQQWRRFVRGPRALQLRAHRLAALLLCHQPQRHPVLTNHMPCQRPTG